MYKLYIMMKWVDKLCEPAYFYFVISIFFYIFIVIQNLTMGNDKKYCMGMYECDMNGRWMLLGGQLLYILFWTYVLNFICGLGYPRVSWFIVLLPFISFFVLIGAVLLAGGSRTISW